MSNHFATIKLNHNTVLDLYCYRSKLGASVMHVINGSHKHPLPALCGNELVSYSSLLELVICGLVTPENKYKSHKFPPK